MGISWLTGASGYLPTNYVERTAETNAWTLHTVIPFGRGRDLGSGVETLDTKPAQDSIASTSINNIGSNSSLERLVGAQECDTRYGWILNLTQVVSDTKKLVELNIAFY